MIEDFEPSAYAVYFHDQPKEELVRDLDELLDDLTNNKHEIVPMYEEELVKQMLEEQQKRFWFACQSFAKVGELVYMSYKYKHKK